MRVKRERLSARRKTVGLSQEALAERLNVERTTVTRWESGESVPLPWTRPRLAKALRVSVEELDELLDEASTAAAGSDVERLEYTLTHPGGTDLVSVAQLRQQIQQLDQQYALVPSSALLADAGQALGQIRFLTAHAANLRVRRELHGVEAEAATLMGQLVWDASQRRSHASAQSYYEQAIAAARQVRDPAAEGLALLRMAMIALYAVQDPRAGLALAEQTVETTQHVSTVLTGLALLHTAEAHAMLGDRQACESALTRADTIHGQLTDLDCALELYSPTQFGRMAGSCYLSLADTGRAVRVLDAALAGYERPAKSQAIVLGNLSLALIRRGDFDEAICRLHEAMDVIEQNWGGGGLNIVFGAGKELRPQRGLPIVQDVLDRMLTLMAG